MADIFFQRQGRLKDVESVDGAKKTNALLQRGTPLSFDQEATTTSSQMCFPFVVLNGIFCYGRSEGEYKNRLNCRLKQQCQACQSYNSVRHCRIVRKCFGNNVLGFAEAFIFCSVPSLAALV